MSHSQLLTLARASALALELFPILVAMDSSSSVSRLDIFRIGARLADGCGSDGGGCRVGGAESKISGLRPRPLPELELGEAVCMLFNAFAVGELMWRSATNVLAKE